MFHHPNQTKTTLYIVRHGRTAANVRRVFRGRIDDPLDTIGLQQAQLVAERIDREFTIDTIIASPLIRAHTTATVIGDRIGLASSTMAELMEINFGALEGSTVDLLQERYPELASRLADPDDLDATWPGGESLRGFHTRVFAAFQAIVTKHGGESVAVVTHGGVIGSLLGQIERSPLNDLGRYAIANCALTQVVVTPDRTEIARVNDVQHLDGLLDISRGMRS